MQILEPFGQVMQNEKEIAGYENGVKTALFACFGLIWGGTEGDDRAIVRAGDRS